MCQIINTGSLFLDSSIPKKAGGGSISFLSNDFQSIPLKNRCSLSFGNVILFFSLVFNKAYFIRINITFSTLLASFDKFFGIFI